MGEEDNDIIKIGPAGNKDKAAWDEKGHSEIVQIFVSHDNAINSIQFQYAENGSLVLSERHGTNNGDKFDVVKLNHPAEYITWISGTRGYTDTSLCSITFGTNHREYGPFGGVMDKAKEFSFRLGEDRQFGGFHGTVEDKLYNCGVKSIGVYLKPNTALDCTDAAKFVNW